MAETSAAGFRASPIQRYLWTLHTASVWPLWGQLTALVRDPVDVAELAERIRRARQRHEALRTGVSTVLGGTAVQVVYAAAAGLDATYRVDDAASDPLDAVRAAERALLGVDGGAAVRVALAERAGVPYALVLTAHPLVADRRSLRLLLAELAADRAHAPDAAGDPAPMQYPDYAAWHHELLADPDRTAERAYWDGHVAPALAAASDRDAADPGGWASHRIRIDAELAAAVEQAAAGLATGADAVLATAWSTLLWRLGGEHDVAATVTVAGRPYAELAGAAGPYARDLPIVCRFDPDGSWAEAARRVATVLADAAARAEDLDPARLTGATGLPGFEYLDDPDPAGPFHPVLEQSRHGSSPLELRAGRDAGGCWVELNHDPAQVPAESAAALLARFTAALRALVAEHEGPVEAAGLLLEGERERCLAAAAGPAVPGPDRCLPELVAAQARRTPDAEAVTCGDRTLNYAELDARANQLAHHLRALGVGAGDTVALRLDRSPEVLVGLLGVLKAGAAYVPVDPRVPAARLEFVLGDVGARALLTKAALADVDPAPGVATVALDRDWPAVAERSDTAPVVPADPDALAYVMYTSGTTGRPNGVAVPHRALVNYLAWAADAYDLRAGTGALVHSALGFDLTVTGLLGPLLVGQRVVLVPDGPDLAGLVAELRARRDLSLVKLTPTHLRVLGQLMPPADLAERVRTLVVGGENLTADVLRPFCPAGVSMRVVNEYGPTETVVGSCAYRVGPELPAGGSIPIGRPIANTRIHLLDPRGEPVPDGVPGEVYIGGAGVARGYLNRAELTTVRFVPDPFGGDGRLYRTGDRARRLPSGDLEYLGRRDDQVKVRGFRVELAEIEHVLAQHSGVGQAAVALVDDTGGPTPVAGPTLVGYVVPAGNAEAPGAAELVEHCRVRLPEYAVPHAVIPVRALPVTPHGKLDRSALATLRPARLGGTRPGDAEFVAPRTPTEQILAAAMAAVLGLDQVGIDDNYFVLGGDSIRSVMVASRARARGVEVAAADLHRYPTIRSCAAALGAAGGADEPVTEPFSLVSGADRALLPPDVEDAFPLNLLQEGMIFHRDFAAKSAVYHAIASVRLQAPFDADLLRLVIRELLGRHPMLRTSFDMSSYSRPLQLVHGTFADPLQVEDLRGLPEAEQQARIQGWVDREKERGFALDDYPLIRFMAQRLDADTFQFTYGFHHEIVDGWSEALLVTELFTHYLSLLFDEPVTIEPPRTTMRDAVALELAAMGDSRNYAFWTEYLREATLMRLPRLLSGPAADKGAREIVRVAVPVDEAQSDALKRLATDCAVPLKSVLLAAHLRAMNQYHGQSDTLTYTVTNGRPEHADGSTAIGLFVNSLALRVDLTGGSWRDLIVRTLESERASMPYRRLPMAELKRHQGNEPLAETLFFFTDYHVFGVLDRWRARGVDHLASELYGESTFPFCAIFRLNRATARLEVRIEYDSLQFPAALIDEIAGCYQRVLAAMVADPDAPYHLPDLLGPGERERVLASWHGAADAATVPAVSSVLELIVAQARRRPDAIAVEHGGTAVSYRELLRRADALAARLRAHGAAPEDRVAILAGRSVEMVAGILGVLRAGAAYLPLDPAHPDDRIAATVTDAEPVLVLAGPGQAARVGSTGFPVLDLDLPPGGPAVAAPLGAPAAIRPEHAAYLMYTSGSTGRPKGVLVSHGALAASTLARGPGYAGRPHRFLLLSPFAVDSSVAGLFWTLCTGGTLLLPREGSQQEPAELTRYLARSRPTHTLAVPSLLRPLLDAAPAAALASLRLVIAAGEPCPAELAALAAGRIAPGCVLANEYGPTEGTVWATVWTGRPDGAVSTKQQLPIGRPVATARVYLLNPHLAPVPVGVTGELYLGGAGVARGYHGRPGATAAVFRPDPHGAPGDRMYRSGDLASLAPSGDLDFLGRADGQVKVRGFRVELGEIEGLLERHPAVAHAVVLARADPVGDQQLVGYVVAAGPVPPEPAQLQAYVRDRLPKYMVPGAFVVLDALPLTAAGKVDRGSLPAPDRAGPPDPGRPPATEVERMLAAIWCQVLGLDEVGIDEEFFALGGESLRAMQVVTRVNKVFDLELSVRSLFDTATIAAFAEQVELARVAAARPLAAVGGPSTGSAGSGG